MPVKVTTIWGAKSHFDDANIMISILNPDGSDGARDFKPMGPKDKHYIARFEDTEHPSDKEWFQMQREVNGILAWVQKSACTLDDNIVVHCHAGISRSPATAWLIMVMLGMDAKEAFQTLWKANCNIWPNTQVLAIGARFLKLPKEFMDLVQQCETEIAQRKREPLGYGG
jgi:predicted protein tyrosine phosphatase